ncbi:MAG: dihydroorotase family protein [Candidatus Peregrinibacteria bacterium]|nr:dihydroorotase family protein [Candidatus Peregrinibacteria bacterium]
MTSVLLRNGTIVRATEEEKADVLLRDGVIERVAPHGSSFSSVDEDVNAAGLLLFPGLIDCHVHFREPGLTQKADMKSESASARAGGVTTVCEMPNTIPPTVTIMALADKVRRAEEISDCDIRFFFGVTDGFNLEALRELWSGTSPEFKHLRERCVGAKLFLDHSTGDQKVQEDILEDIFRACGELKIPMVCHCEDPEMNAQAAQRKDLPNDVSAHSLMRPPESEVRSIEKAITLAEKYKTPLHIAHLSTAGGMDLIRSAKAAGLSVTCEVAPHHLLLNQKAYAHLGTLAKMNPPLRTEADQAALWQGIKDGVVDCIATDHAPHTLEEKNVADPRQAPSGIPGVATMLPLLLTCASAKQPRFDPQASMQPNTLFRYQDIVRLCFENPNRIFGLGKQGLREGSRDAIVLVDPKREWTITAAQLKSKCGWTPYEGWKVSGSVVRVI